MSILIVYMYETGSNRNRICNGNALEDWSLCDYADIALPESGGVETGMAGVRRNLEGGD
jgi:hypothetical protein